MIYQFKCKNCGEIFEIRASYEALFGLKTSCPNCMSGDIQRHYMTPNISFHGKGFYSTDNATVRHTDE
jgi:putative FmdB family regulatory protein